mmetsp:Transcript_82084/g.227625  ORF Transcript_82084/g.227625 Transcript_82084/m.227625 type:complete len:94 (+) Transcript_82084:144-425(+)
MKNIAEFGVGIVGNPAYAALFDATSTSYLGSLRPYLMQLACRCMQALVLFGLCWDAGAEGGLSKVLDTIQRESEEAAAKEAQSQQVAAEKKTE